MNPIETQSNNSYIAFMAHLPMVHHVGPLNGMSMLHYLEQTLKEYDIGGYIIGHEMDPFSHYHVTVQMSDKDYHKFSARVFKKMYKLRGRAVPGHPRQYGKVKSIDNVERMKAYTLKAGSFVTNLCHDEIEKLKKIAHEKAIDNEFEDKICRAIACRCGTERHFHFVDLRLAIIKEYIRANITTPPSKGKINKIGTLWYWKYADKHDEYAIYESIYGTLPPH